MHVLGFGSLLELFSNKPGVCLDVLLTSVMLRVVVHISRHEPSHFHLLSGTRTHELKLGRQQERSMSGLVRFAVIMGLSRQDVWIYFSVLRK